MYFFKNRILHFSSTARYTKKRIGVPVNECFAVSCETESHTSRVIETFPFPKDVLPLLLTLYLTRSSVRSNHINQMAVNTKPFASEI